VFGSEEELVITGYIDASFQTDTDDSKSQSSFEFCLNGGAVSWKSSKQDTIEDLMMKDEYIAASKAVKEVVSIKKFVSKLGVIPNVSSPMDIYYGNSGAIVQEKEPRSHKITKHVLQRYYFICEIINRGDVRICMVHIDHNVADQLMNHLPQPKHEAHMWFMGIRYLHQ
jgi:hypothetical protein